MSQSSDTGLRRAIGLPHATAMVVGTIIGASIFVQPSEVTGQVGSIGGVFFVWVVAGALTLIGALVSAELASTFSESGGVYVYLREAYGRPVGFLWGWAMFWVMHSGIIAALATIFARYAGFFVPLGPLGTDVVAILVIWVLTAINYLGVKQGSNLQTVFTLGKLLAIVLIIVVGWALGSRVPGHFQSSGAVEHEAVGNITGAIIAALFAFGGWHMVTYNSEETVNPRTVIPKALIIGTVTVTLCYVAMNAVYLYILPLETVASSTRVAADAADALLGFGGGALMSGLVVFSTFGGLSGIVLSGPRVYYAMSRDGMLFKWAGAIHPVRRTPHRALFAQAVWSSVLVATGTYRALFTRVVYTEWIFFGLMALGLYFIRRRTDVQRQYSVLGYPWLPAVFVISSFAIVLDHIGSSPVDSLAGLGVVILGLPVYYLWVRDPERK